MLEPKILGIGAPTRGSPRSGLKANEKGSQHGWHAGTLFLRAFYRRIYERSLIAADSRSLFMLNVQLSTLETAESRHSRPQNSWTVRSRLVLFFHSVNQILNGADYGNGEDTKD
jgi:hypothetical protein